MCYGMGCRFEDHRGNCTTSNPRCPDDEIDEEPDEEPDDIDPSDQEISDAEDRYFNRE